MSPEAVFVESAARLHFGVLDLRGGLGRWFGGIGAAAPAPTLLVSAAPADALRVEGPDRVRAREAAERFLRHHRLPGAHVRVHRALPPHAGLGSGTQLALAVAQALATLYRVDADAPALARAVGRARRSAVGTWTFAGGGFVVEGGHPPDREDVAPLLVRLSFPSSWHCVVAVPRSSPAVSGAAEEAAFASLPPPPQHEVERVSYLVLMALLPAIVEADLRTFGTALSEIQSINGRWFAPIQGGTFAPGPTQELVRRMVEWGACGAGQSSWGPTVYGVVQGRDAAQRLAQRVTDLLGSRGRVYTGPFRAEGARVRRAREE